MKAKILKSFSLAFTLSTYMQYLPIAFVALATLPVKAPLFRKGGMLTETPWGTMS